VPETAREGVARKKGRRARRVILERAILLVSGGDIDEKAWLREIDKSGVEGKKGIYIPTLTQGEFRLSDDRYQYRGSWDIPGFILSAFIC
jgi:hypothetical protein